MSTVPIRIPMSLGKATESSLPLAFRSRTGTLSLELLLMLREFHVLAAGLSHQASRQRRYATQLSHLS